MTSTAVDRTPATSLPPPANYEDLFLTWSPYVARVARHIGIPSQEVDDFVSDVMLYFVSKDSLSYYDPAVAPFSTFLRAYVIRRGFSFRRSLATDRLGLALSPDAPYGTEGDEVRGDHMAAPPTRYDDWIVNASEIKSFHDSLLATGDDLLATLFARVCFEVSNENEVNRYRLAQFLELSVSRVDVLMLELRARADAYGLLR